MGELIKQSCQHQNHSPVTRMYIPFGRSLIPYRRSHLLIDILKNANKHQTKYAQTPPPRPFLLSKESPTIIIMFGELTKEEFYATKIKEGLAPPPHNIEGFK